MDDRATKEKPKRNSITLIAGWFLAVLYMTLCIIVAIFGRRQIADRSTPTPTVTITPGPHIFIHPPSEQGKIIYEDFSSNYRDWGLYFQFGKLEVINGKLILQSVVQRGYAVGTSRLLSPSGEKYYIQADFSTDTDTAYSYGLVFGLNKSLVTYYTFEIWPRSGGFRLFKYNAGKWTELIPYTRAEINPYPQATTLSVLFDKGSMELYINGKVVSQYSETDFFQSKDIGVFVNNTGYRLFIDNFFVYDEE